MDPVQWALIFALRVVPWLLVGAGIVAVVSWSPLGRGLLRLLRERHEEARLNRQLVDELLTLRAELGEAVERLDVTEQRLAQLLPGTEPGPGRVPRTGLPNPDRIVTPH